MANTVLQIAVEKRWMMRSGTFGLVAAWVLLKLGAPVTWFFRFSTAVKTGGTKDD